MSLITNRFRRFASSSIAVLFFSGCFIQHEKPQPSGFLGSADLYSQMVYNQQLSVMENIPDPSQLKKYQSFVVAPVRVVGSRGAKDFDVKDLEIQRLTEDLRRELIEALGSKHSVVASRASNVAILEVAITNVQPSRGLGIAGVGGASMEAKVIDSITGKQVAAVMDSRQGDKGHFLDSMTRWRQTQGVFKEWAQNLRRRLDG